MNAVATGDSPAQIRRSYCFTIAESVHGAFSRAWSFDRLVLELARKLFSLAKLVFVGGDSSVINVKSMGKLADCEPMPNRCLLER